MLAALLAVSVPPRPGRYATDRAGVADAARLAALNERLAQFERDTSSQVLVYLDRRLPANTTLEEFAAASYKAWGVGQKGKDNGAVFFAFIDERKMRIEVGYGLEGAIPDARAQRILDEYVKPRFRAGDFAGGAEQAASEIMKAARGEPYQGSGLTVAERGLPAGPLPAWLWGIPIVALGAAWLVGRGGETTTARMIRGGAAFAAATTLVSFVSVWILNDPRPMALGFGVALGAVAAGVPIAIGRHTALTGRRRLGLTFLQAAAGLLAGALALMLFSVAWLGFMSLAGYAMMLGIPALLVGGLLHSEDPVRVLVVFFARAAFVVLLVSTGVFSFLRYLVADGSQTAMDVMVVSAIVWFVLWIIARSRGWKLVEKIELVGSSSGWSYSSGGSSSGSSDWGSSSGGGGGSSFSGGGGSSGGGGASGSW
jgi:uncharacterized protein